MGMTDKNKKLISTDHPKESAGARMTTYIPIVRPEETIGQVFQLLKTKIGQLETINYIYVTDEQGKLVGVFSVKEVFRQPPETKIKDIMDKPMVTVRARTDQERVALLALKHSLKAIPVVDKEGLLLGVVPSDVILEILHSEAGEDILHFAGTRRVDSRVTAITQVSLWRVIKARLPWLLVGLFGGILAARVVEFFESTLEVYIALAMFIPVMVYMSDAAGTQTSIIFIRSLSLDHQLIVREYLFKEFKSGFFIALVCGLILAAITYLWHGSPVFGLIVGLAMFATIIFAVLIGVFIPWLLERFKVDPAIGSGPFGTVIRDITSLLIYFTIASALLHLL